MTVYIYYVSLLHTALGESICCYKFEANKVEKGNFFAVMCKPIKSRWPVFLEVFAISLYLYVCALLVFAEKALGGLDNIIKKL